MLFAMGAPSYDARTLAAYFHGLEPAWFDHADLGPTLRALAEQDPDVLAAVADVDRSQITTCLARSPLERVRVASRLWHQRTRFKRAQ
jgi:hypothetical protein